MGEQNSILHKNLHLMYLGGLLTIAAFVLIWIPGINVFAALGSLAGGVVTVVGLVKLRNQHPAYMSAVGLLILRLIPGAKIPLDKWNSGCYTVYNNFIQETYEKEK